MTENEKDFIKFVKTQCRYFGVNLYMSKGSYVKYGSSIKCNGFFRMPPNPKLAIATGRPKNEWFPIFIHEFAHMLQWCEQDGEWLNNYFGTKEACDILDEWMAGNRKVNKKLLDEATIKCIDVELGAEKRVIDLIEDFSLDIDKEVYCQRANSYVLFYHMVKETGKWYTIGKEPYNIKELWSHFPKDFDYNQYELNPRLRDLYLKHIFGE